jgi:hypothetical protein
VVCEGVFKKSFLQETPAVSVAQIKNIFLSFIVLFLQ